MAYSFTSVTWGGFENADNKGTEGEMGGYRWKIFGKGDSEEIISKIRICCISFFVCI